MATNTLHIRVRSDGTRVVGKNIKGIGESANLASRQVFIMRRAIQTLFAAIGVRAGFRAIEQFTELNNKLKTVTKTTSELISVRKKLLAIANDSRTEMSATVQLYARTTRAIKKLGLSEAKRLKFTSLLTKEAVVGGATTIEATNAIRQLTQGMGAAGLKGEELRSVLEQLPTVAQRIAEFMGVAQSELRKLGEEGKLTGEVVVAAMLAAEESIEAAFGETTSTVGQSFQVLKNSFVEFVGNIDKFLGVSKALAASLQLIAQNLALISTLLIGLAGQAILVKLAARGLTLAAAIGLATRKAAAFVKALFVIKTVVPVVKSATASFLAMTTAATMARTAVPAVVAAAPAVVAGLPAAAILAIVAAITLLVGWLWSLADSNQAVAKRTKVAAEEQKDFRREVEKNNKIIQKNIDLVSRASELEVAGLGNEGDGLKVNFAAQMNLKELEKVKPKLFDLLLDLEKLEKQMKVFKGKDTMFDARLAEDIKELRTEIEKLAGVNIFDSVGKVLDNFTNIDQRVAQILELVRKVQSFEFTKDELAGGSLTIKSDKKEGILERISELNMKSLTLEGVSLTRALEFLNEEMDELTGGSKAATEQLLAENAIFNKFGGDMAAIGMRLAGATEAQVKAYQKAKKEQDALKDSQSKAVAEQRAATRQQEQQKEAIDRTISSLREEIRLFGLVGRARDLAKFAERPGVGPGEIKEVQELQNILGRKETESSTKSQVLALRTRIAEFAKVSEVLRKLISEAPPKKAKELENLLKEGQVKLDQAAKNLAEKLATEVGSSATDMVLEAEEVLVAGGTKIGTAVGTAFAAAFKAALAGAIPGITALKVPGGDFPVGPGDPSGSGLTEEQKAQQDAAAETQRKLGGEIDSNINKIKDMTLGIQTFGFEAEKSSGRAQGALKGFGEEAITLGGELKNAFSSIFGSLEDALVGFVTTGKLDFKSLINSIIADLARMVIRMLIIKPLMGFFGGLFGGFFGFSGGGSVGGAFGLPGFAGGGLVNENPAVPQRFAVGGQVRGSGTGVSDSVPALLSRDEFVVNAAASRPNMAGLEYLNQTGRMPGGGSVTSVSYSPIVSVTVEGNSANAAGDGAQIAKDMEQQMRAQFNEFVSQEQRPGGAFSKTNEDVL